ncbi:MAG: YggT family protein [Treponema sp.]|nr:YggT family protein [Treponema sp.]
MRSFFSLLAVLVELYSILCIARLFLTWIPGASYSRVTEWLSKICDPFLNIFRGVKFLRAGAIDFSPALALCVLAVLSSLFKTLSYGIILSPLVLLAVFFSVLESFIISILSFILVVLIIRLIIIFVQGLPMNRSPLLESLDSVLSPFCYTIAKTFTMGRSVKYKTALIISIITLIAVIALTSLLFNVIGNLLIKGTIAIHSI